MSGIYDSISVSIREPYNLEISILESNGGNSSLKTENQGNKKLNSIVNTAIGSSDSKVSEEVESIEHLHEKLASNWPQLQFSKRTYFKLFEEYTRWFLNGEKTTTIRYDPEGIDLIGRPRLPLIVTSPDGKMEPYQLGEVIVRDVTIKQFENLNNQDAVNDGFGSVRELKTALSSIYKGIGGDEFVTIYSIEPMNLTETDPNKV